MARPWKIPYLNPDENLKVCLYRILRTRLLETLSYERLTLQGSDIEALHNMRISSRRLHAIMRLFSDCFPKKKFNRHSKKIQGLIRSLGAVRDLDIFIEILENHKQALPPHDQKIFDLLLARQHHLRRQARRNLVTIFKQLHKEGYEQQFLRFLAESLASD